MAQSVAVKRPSHQSKGTSMTPQQIDTMKLALEALEEAWIFAMSKFQPTEKAIDLYDKARAAIKEALAEHAMRETQRLGQEIEQEPEVDLRARWPMNKWKENKPPLPQRKPLTDEQRKDLMNKAWNKWLGGEDDNHLFAWHFSFEVEAAHGIKGDA